MKVNDIPHEATANANIFDSFIKASSVLAKHDSGMASISSGADSGAVLDLLTRLDADHCIKYVWFNTGLEYAATKRHLDELKSRYGIKIERFRAVKSVPLCCREYGQPFVNRFVSSVIHSLQIKHFDWTDMPYDEMVEKTCLYNANWRHSRYGRNWKGGNSVYDVQRSKYLKEFLIAPRPSPSAMPAAAGPRRRWRRPLTRLMA